MLRIYATCYFLLLIVWLNAQTNVHPKSQTRIEGIVYEYGTTNPIDVATVSLSQGDLFTLSDKKGMFTFDKVDPGRVELVIRSLGMETIDTTVTIVTDRTNRFVFYMQISSFRLKEVEVTAVSSKAGQATASRISRQALDHLQASSLTDVMQLIPGVAIKNPNMGSENTVNIRGAGLSNSLGASIIVDGSPLSNNSNLQALAPTLEGTTNAAIQYKNIGNIAGGIDTRTLSLDNIESIEVIRGIPSVEYGDLTSGAVIVKSRSGRDPLRIKVKTNPELYQGSVSRGFSLGENLGTLNLSGDYLYTVKNPIESYAFFQRFSVKALWANKIGQKLYTTTSLDLNYGKDTRNKNPDDLSFQLRDAAGSIGLRLNTNGNLNINSGWLKTIEYTVAGSFTDKHSWKEQLLSSASSIYSTTMKDGATISNYPGQSVYDNLGNEITYIPPGTEKDWSTYLPNEYLCRWDIYGKEINVNAKIKAVFSKQWEKTSNRIVVGADFKSDGNRGRGKVYDDRNPPFRASSNKAYRPRPYFDIPFINMLGIYAEDRVVHKIKDRSLSITAGARFDVVNGKTILAPRTNFSLDLLPDILTLRGGYGITAKAPTLVYLYPEKAYFDYSLYTNVEDPTNLFTLIRTHTFSTENKDLKIASNRKAELGVDIKINRYRLSLTAYDELMKNGYDLAHDLSRSFNLVQYPHYSLAGDLQPGKVPTLKLDNAHNVFAFTPIPKNCAYEHNRGVEIELDLGRFDAIQTSFYLNGAYTRNTWKSTNYSYVTNGRPGYLERNIGVYEPGRESLEEEHLLTTLRITHNIPGIGFVVTLTGQTIWKGKEWYAYSTDLFSKYISYKDGRVYDYDPSLNDDPEFRYLINPIDPNRELPRKAAIRAMFFNLNLSKEIGNFLTASFFANNVFYRRPIYESIRTPGSFIEMGEELFFGFDLKITIK